MYTATVNVSFAVDSVDADTYLAIMLDEEKNQSVYKVEKKNSFALGETAYLKIFSKGEDALNIFSSIGNVQIVQGTFSYSIEEDISFTRDNTGSLSYVPIGSVSYTWFGRGIINPVFVGREILLQENPEAEDAKKFLGIMRCTYSTVGKRATLNVSSLDEEVGVLVAVERGADLASATINYEADLSNPIPISLRVSDFCSDLPVDVVSVYVDGNFKGWTNIEGILYIGELRPGTMHTLKMTREGYVDSDLDILYNDSFTVPIPPKEEEEEQ